LISKKKKKKTCRYYITSHTKRAGSIDEILISSKKEEEQNKQRLEFCELFQNKSQYGKDINDVRFIIHTHTQYLKKYIVRGKRKKERENNNK
jgi:UDP-2,3-diacylglucosamine pyrophosphatase LpxH